MSRTTRRRASRVLAIVLIVTLVAGIALAVRKFTQSDEAAASNAGVAAGKQDAGLVKADNIQAKGNAVMPLLAAAATGEKALIRTETPLAPLATPTTHPTTNPVVRGTIVAPVVTTPPVSLTGNPLLDGQAYIDAGDPIAARTVFSEALVDGRLGESDTLTAKSLLTKINQEAILGRRSFKNDPLCMLYTTKPGDVLQKVAADNAVTWELLCRANGITEPRKVRAGQTIKVIKGPFHAVVSKSKFTIDLYLGSPGEAGATYVMSFPVGLGKDDSTPAGTWVVQNKLKNPPYYSPRGEGIIAANDPKNPLGEFWIGLTGIEGQAVGKTSYGIHGTIDPDSIGKEESMGCIRLRNEDVALVYQMLVDGKSRVVVKE